MEAVVWKVMIYVSQTRMPVKSGIPVVCDSTLLLIMEPPPTEIDSPWVLRDLYWQDYDGRLLPQFLAFIAT
jgi:hypothetical protein